MNIDKYLQASDHVANYLTESWVSTIKNLIKSSFKNIGKGWFNLNVELLETYMHSKFHRFLYMVKLMMCDAMRSMSEKSLQDFVSFITKHLSAKIKISAIDKVEVSLSKLEKARPSPKKEKEKEEKREPFNV